MNLVKFPIKIKHQTKLYREQTKPRSKGEGSDSLKTTVRRVLYVTLVCHPFPSQGHVREVLTSTMGLSSHRNILINCSSRNHSK